MIYCIARLKELTSNQVKKIKLDVPYYSLQDLLSQIDLKDYKYFWFEQTELIVTKNDYMISYDIKVLNKSETFFINAYVETYEDVLVKDPMLAQQMTNLGWTHIVRNIGTENNWVEQFLDGVDKIVDLNGDAV